MISVGVARLGLSVDSFMALTPREFFTALWVRGYEDLKGEMPTAIQSAMIASALGAKAEWYDFTVNDVPERMRRRRPVSQDVLRKKMDVVAAAFGAVKRENK